MKFIAKTFVIILCAVLPVSYADTPLGNTAQTAESSQKIQIEDPALRGLIKRDVTQAEDMWFDNKRIKSLKGMERAGEEGFFTTEDNEGKKEKNMERTLF